MDPTEARQEILAGEDRSGLLGTMALPRNTPQSFLILKKSMRTKFKLGYVALLMPALLAACGGDGGNNAAPNTTPNPTPSQTPSYTIGGNLTGLDAANKLVLQDNGADDLTLTVNGAFTFATQIALNNAYAVTVKTNPYWQSCSVTNGTGSPTAAVTNIDVNCGPASANVTTFAGSKTPGNANGQGSSASFSSPYGVAVDAAGNLYVADNNNNLVRKIDPNGNVTTLAGTGASGSADGPGTSATFSKPWYTAVDSAGNVYVGDYGNNKIRKIAPNGDVTTLAGSGAPGSADGAGVSATFRNPEGVAVDAAGNVYVADYLNNEIRKIDPNGNVTTLAGSTTPGSADGKGTSASFNNPRNVAADGAGNLYVADTDNNKIRKIDTSGSVTTLAGSGTSGHADGRGAAASFAVPRGIAVDVAGNVYVADTGNNLIRKIDPSGNVITLAGSTTGGSADGKGSSAQFSGPYGVAVDAAGNLYVADSSNNLIRKIMPTP